MQRERFRTRRGGCEENDIPRWKIHLLLVASTLGDNLWLAMKRCATHARVATEERGKRACEQLVPHKVPAISRVYSSSLTFSESQQVHNNGIYNIYIHTHIYMHVGKPPFPPPPPCISTYRSISPSKARECHTTKIYSQRKSSYISKLQNRPISIPARTARPMS